MKHLILLVILVACSHEKVELKTPLNYLNGNNFQSPHGFRTDVLSIPITGLNPTNKATSITGTLFLKENFIFIPLNHKKIILLNNESKVLTSATTDANGNFKFIGYFENGTYKLQVIAPKHVGTMNFKIDSYEINNLKIFAHSK